MDYELSEEQRKFKADFRSFCDKEIAPRAITVDQEGTFSFENHKRLAEIGILGLPVPEHYGGGGKPLCTKIISDYTTKNVGHFLGIVKDKVVLSTPMVNSPITSGSGVITANFTLEQAKSLAVYFRVRRPLPIPLKVLRVSDIGK